MKTGPRNKLWSIDTLDCNGNEGLFVLMAKTKEEAEAKVHKWRPNRERILNCESVLGVELLMVSGDRGESYYYKTKTHKVQ